MIYLERILLIISNKYSSVVLTLNADIINGNCCLSEFLFSFSERLCLYSLITFKHSNNNSA